MAFQRTAVIARLVVCAVALIVAGVPAALFVTAGPASAQSAYSFSSVSVQGNQRIDAQTVRAIADVPIGASVSGSDLSAALGRLEATGLFADVSLEPQGGTLVIRISENPMINQISFEGNAKTKDEELIAITALKPNVAFSADLAEVDAQMIVEFLKSQGRYNAEVRPMIIRLPNNQVNLVFEINEAKVTGVSKVNFVGNQVYSDWRLLRVIETSENGILSFLLSTDSFDRSRMEQDEQLLRDFYLERGYADFEVRSSVAELERERDNFFLTYDIYEGPLYRFGQVSVSSSILSLPPVGFTGQNNVRTGDLFSADAIEQAVEDLESEAQLRKVSFVVARPVLTRNELTQTIDVEFVLETGPRVFIERIDITGNTTTLDRVIRRQFALAEGDPLSARSVREAEEQLRELGFFVDVRSQVYQGSSPNQVIVAIDAEDTTTGSFSFGLNYASDTGLGGVASISERNFLGRGQFINFELAVGQDNNVLQFAFTEPALLDRDLLAGFKAYYQDQTYTESSFDSTVIAFEPRIAFPLSDKGDLALRYILSSDDIQDFGNNVSPIIEEEQGTVLTSAVGLVYEYDALDSRIDTTKGYLFMIDAEFAGLGGQAHYTKTSASLQMFTNLFEEDLILSAEFEGGVLSEIGDGNSRITDRYFLGGDSFRGFQYGGIGPRDKAPPINDALGGNYFYMGRFQASFPIGLPDQYGIYGGVFLDAGSLWGLNDVTGGASGTIDDAMYLRAAAGISLYWQSPIGPLQFNWANPFLRLPYDETEVFRLTVGTRF
jgi:outer membrane protein insertion porin family